MAERKINKPMACKVEERTILNGEATEDIYVPVQECDDAAAFRKFVGENGEAGATYVCMRQVGPSLAKTVVEKTKLIEG